MVQFHVAFYSGQKTPAGPRVLKHKRAAVCTRGVICFHPFRFMAGIYKEANPTIHKCVMYLTEWGGRKMSDVDSSARRKQSTYLRGRQGTTRGGESEISLSDLGCFRFGSVSEYVRVFPIFR